ncbi:MAG: NADH-quinone oxidoreductase subunit I [bacterium]
MIERKVIVRDVKLTAWQKTYYPEVIRGLWVTASHFFRNFARHWLRYVFRMKSVTPGAVTIQYPEEKRPVSSRWRGRHRLMLRPDGTPRCVACMMCESACPDQCICITAAETLDGRIEKYPVTFDIDLLRCCFCGLCVEACPEDAIRMDSFDLELAGYSRTDFLLDREFLLRGGNVTSHPQYEGELEGKTAHGLEAATETSQVVASV